MVECHLEIHRRNQLQTQAYGLQKNGLRRTHRIVQKKFFGVLVFLLNVTLRWVRHTLQKCKAEATSEQPAGKPNRNCSPKKIDVTRKLPVGSVSVVTLIRTDTTLDHSQKAEKV